MKKRALTLFFLILSGLFVVTGCSQEAQPPEESAVSVDANDVWAQITETSPYKQWDTWPGHPDIYPGKSPHGKYLRLYANGPAITAAREGEPMPDGAILVKENYAEDKTTLKAVTPMYKVDGYNPDAGDWWWAKYGPEGTVMKAGKVEGCINCHKAVEDKDWIFTEAQ
jgi:hypothetical protein